jgi:predicted nucleic acid-binding Zn finger protein
MVATAVLAKVEKGRLQKAVEGVVNGAYTITVAQQDETEIRGFITNGDGQEYGVVLSEGQHFCSCPDAMYRRGICKHAVALAPRVIRNPRTEAKAKAEQKETRPVDLKLARVRPGWTFAA